jgi:hypothetical protein
MGIKVVRMSFDVSSYDKERLLGRNDRRVCGSEAVTQDMKVEEVAT